MTPEFLDALRRAVNAAPHDVALRLHLADQLLQAGDAPSAITEIAAALQSDPASAAAREAMNRALALAASDTATAPDSNEPTAPADAASTTPHQGSAAADEEFDWAAAAAQLQKDGPDPLLAEPVESHSAANGATDNSTEPPSLTNRFRIEPPGITLSDVGGMDAVKDRLTAAFLAPLRNPRLRERYGKSLRGGLLLYGPPGCGKTMLARALAGELGAGFMTIGITDILDPYFGQSERNLHEAFQVARREAPCVLFFDEIDSLGARRSQTTSSLTRSAVNQLLAELDGVDTVNEGVFVLAATNQPWDVDPALRRPGRLDRTALVLPPDESARAAIFRHHLRGRPVVGVDVAALARRSDGLSGADIFFVCESATERALLHGARTGEIRDIGQEDLVASLAQVRPSIGPWLDSARNVVLFGSDDGTYAELRAYLKKVKRL
jgi:SpoVK/Ycf46/Vps4 family AAA+-type ATPase